MRLFAHRYDQTASVPSHTLWDGLTPIDTFWAGPTAGTERGISMFSAGNGATEQRPYVRATNATRAPINSDGWAEYAGLNQKSQFDWMFTDHLGSTAAFANFAGVVSGGLAHGAWGEALEGTFGKSSMTYAGTQRDGGTGLQYAWHRFYDPTQGRFASRDPIGFAGGDLNLYRYVGSDPVNNLDPLGLIRFRRLQDGWSQGRLQQLLDRLKTYFSQKASRLRLEHVAHGLDNSCPGVSMAPLDYLKQLNRDDIVVDLSADSAIKLNKSGMAGDEDVGHYARTTTDGSGLLIEVALEGYDNQSDAMFEQVLMHELTHIGQESGHHDTENFRWFTYKFLEEPRYQDVHTGWNGFTPGLDPAKAVGQDTPPKNTDIAPGGLRLPNPNGY